MSFSPSFTRILAMKPSSCKASMHQCNTVFMQESGLCSFPDKKCLHGTVHQWDFNTIQEGSECCSVVSKRKSLHIDVLHT